MRIPKWSSKTTKTSYKLVVYRETIPLSQACKLWMDKVDRNWLNRASSFKSKSRARSWAISSSVNFLTLQSKLRTKRGSALRGAVEQVAVFLWLPESIRILCLQIRLRLIIMEHVSKVCSGSKLWLRILKMIQRVESIRFTNLRSGMLDKVQVKWSSRDLLTERIPSKMAVA